ncbi:MAG: hypothetical protein WCD57_13325, partial [Acidobacteriaceae bacterium]
FGLATALRCEIGYSAHPLYFQKLGFVCADFISAGFSYLRQITECAADLVPIIHAFTVDTFFSNHSPDRPLAYASLAGVM